ncbi:MAG: NAD(P)/FAD-dependent oxidoreductase [Pseudomonadota bacterium]
MTQITADYLVVGGGAMGMAFIDELITDTDATIALVDKHHQVGGHWNDAYPYVRLHQPSAFYGVNSKDLGSNVVDQTGWNKGLYELATNSEVCAYFDQVMQQTYLPSGRLQYFPMCEFDWDAATPQFKSLVSGETYEVVSKKIVNATYMNVTVPSMRPPPYPVSDGVDCIAPNDLPGVSGQYDEYVVIGAGKTGMDACLFLLKNGVGADRIRWVMPRDSWIFDRSFIQPGKEFANRIGQNQVEQLKAAAAAEDLDDLLNKSAATGFIMRFDDEVWPTMWRCATVTSAELEQLRKIKGVVRKGRVTEIKAQEIVLEQGVEPTSGQVLHIDCTADGLERRPQVPVFNGERITLQSVRTCQQVFSAAFIGHIEATYPDADEAKNELCTPVPHPDDNRDFVRCNLANSVNAARWSSEPGLSEWLLHARLDGFSDPELLPDLSDPEVLAQHQENQQQMRSLAEAANANMQRILAE